MAPRDLKADARYPLTAEPVYFDGTKIRPKLGRHGLKAKLGNAEMILPAEAYGWQPGKRFDPVDPTKVVSRRNNESSEYDSLNNNSVVEFIAWGKSHRYFSEDYGRVAPHWREVLLTECLVTARGINSDQAIARDVLESDGSFGAWMTNGIKHVADAIRGQRVFKPEEFDPLERETWRIRKKLKDAGPEAYDVIHETGVILMKIRYRQRYLNRRLRQAMKGLIDAAGWGLEAATTVESVAFSVLDLYGQVRFAASPAQKAAYQCGLIFVRVGARSLGEHLAESSYRTIIRRAGQEVRKSFPPVASDLVKGYLKRGFKNPQKPMPGEQFIEELVGLKIWFLFFTVDYFVFGEGSKPGVAKSAKNEAFLRALAEAGSLELAGSIIRIIGAQAKQRAKSSTTELWIERLEGLLPAIMTAIVSEVSRLTEMAEAQKKPFYSVLCAEMGTVVIHLLKDIGMAFAAVPLKEKMGEMHKRDQQYYRALFLSLYLRVKSPEGSRPRSRAKPAIVRAADKKPQVAPETDLPKPGKDADGDIGVTKFVAAPGPAEPPDNSVPSKPKRAVRKKVKLLPVDEAVGEPKTYVATSTSKGDGASARVSRQAIDERILLAHENILAARPDPLRNMLEQHGRIDMLSDFASVDPALPKTRRLEKLKAALRGGDEKGARHWIEWHHTFQQSSDTTMAGEVETIQPVSRAEHLYDEHNRDFAATPTAGIRGGVTSPERPIYDSNDPDVQMSRYYGYEVAPEFDDSRYTCLVDGSLVGVIDGEALGIIEPEHFDDD